MWFYSFVRVYGDEDVDVIEKTVAAEEKEEVAGCARWLADAGTGR